MRMHLPTLRMSRATMRLHMLCAFFALGSFVWGYNIGILGTVYAHPGFKAILDYPTSGQYGLMTAIYYLGTWLSYIFLSHPLSDLLGRRFAIMVGLCISSIGSAFMASASGRSALVIMVIGRFVCGLGIAIVSTSVPMYQSEISPAKQRGKFVVMNHIGLVAGLAVAFWVGYGMTFWSSPYAERNSWRVSIVLQYIPGIIFCLGLPFCHETPRWLAKNSRLPAAQASLTYVRTGLASPSEINDELAGIRTSISAEKSRGDHWNLLFKRQDLFSRLWRATLLQFMAQMCGATAIKYYLPALFQKLGLQYKASLMIGAIESSLKIFCTVLEMLVIDRYGRRLTMMTGSMIMTVSLMINGILPTVYPNNSNYSADIVCIAFIFVFTFGYSLGFGPSAWVYGSEIFPTLFRARGLNLAASGGSLGSVLVALLWPVGLSAIGSRVYFIFMALNAVCIPVIWLFYPETKGLSLEEMDGLFHVREEADNEELEGLLQGSGDEL